MIISRQKMRISSCSPSGFCLVLLLSQCFSGGCFLLYSQPIPSVATLHPSYANVGDSISSLQVSAGQISLDSEITVRWNGVDRATTIQTAPNGSTLTVPVYPSDLAAPGAAEIVVYSPISGVVIGPIYFFVGVAVNPSSAIYDSQRGRIWLSVGATSTSSSFPSNSVVAVDPDTGVAGPVLPVTGSPTALALSDDFHYLYAASGSFVQQFDLTSMSSVRQITVPNNGTAQGIAVMPGASETLAIVYSYIVSPVDYTIVGIFDKGVARAGTGSAPGATVLFNSAGTRIFAGAFCQEDCSATLTTWTVGPTGLSAPVTLPTGGAPVAVNGNLIYTTGGQAIDWTSGNRVANFGTGGPAFYDANLARFFVLQLVPYPVNNSPSYVIAIDPVAEAVLGSIELNPSNTYAPDGLPAILVPFGTDGVAIPYSGTFIMFHTGLRQPEPSFTAAGLINSASGASGAIAPGEIVSIYGNNVGTASPAAFQVARNGTMMPPLDVSVWFGDLPGTVIYESSTQVNVMVPQGLLPSGTTAVEVVRNSIPSAPVQIPVAAAAPGLFQNPNGALVALNKDGSVNSAANPAHAGDYVVLYGTGGGPTPGENPNLVAVAAIPTPQSASATVGGQNATVLYCGSAPGLISGAFQVNLLLPAGLTGAQSVVIAIGGASSQQGVTIAIQ
jgi:uncharacterized protein (TIGR03437 family)